MFVLNSESGVTLKTRIADDLLERAMQMGFDVNSSTSVTSRGSAFEIGRFRVIDYWPGQRYHLPQSTDVAVNRLGFHVKEHGKTILSLALEDFEEGAVAYAYLSNEARLKVKEWMYHNCSNLLTNRPADQTNINYDDVISSAIFTAGTRKWLPPYNSMVAYGRLAPDDISREEGYVPWLMSCSSFDLQTATLQQIVNDEGSYGMSSDPQYMREHVRLSSVYLPGSDDADSLCINFGTTSENAIRHETAEMTMHAILDSLRTSPSMIGVFPDATYDMLGSVAIRGEEIENDEFLCLS